MQFEQLHPFLLQNPRHFSPSTGHFSTPPLLEGPIASAEGSQPDIAPTGHAFTQRLHFLQRSTTPKEIGGSDTRGMSVNTLHIRRQEPCSGVVSMPFRPHSPNPASTARGTLKAVSFYTGRDFSAFFVSRLRECIQCRPSGFCQRFFRLALNCSLLRLGNVFPELRIPSHP